MQGRAGIWNFAFGLMVPALGGQVDALASGALKTATRSRAEVEGFLAVGGGVQAGLAAYGQLQTPLQHVHGATGPRPPSSLEVRRLLQSLVRGKLIRASVCHGVTVKWGAVRAERLDPFSSYHPHAHT
eukprot:188900-Chlamydomonas_euryale.AAC.1